MTYPPVVQRLLLLVSATAFALYAYVLHENDALYSDVLPPDTFGHAMMWACIIACVLTTALWLLYEYALHKQHEDKHKVKRHRTQSPC